MKKYLVYTFADNYEYCLYALCLFKSIRASNTLKPDFKLYLPVLNPAVLRFLKQFGDELKALSVSIVPCSNLIRGNAYFSKFNRTIKDYPNDFIKILGLGEVHYDFAIFLDADMIVTGDILSDISADFSYTDGPASPLNSGFLAFVPNLLDFNTMLDWIHGRRYSLSTGWNGHRLSDDHSYQQWCQGLLYAYYCTGEKMNLTVCCLKREVFNCQHISHQEKNTKVLHFTSAGKPFRYFFENTRAREWIIHSDWHEQWINTAKSIDGFSVNVAKLEFLRNKSPLKRLMHQIRAHQ